jgi:hypothetical protein
MILILILVMVSVGGLTIYLSNKSKPLVNKNDDVIPDKYYEIPSQLKFKSSWFSDNYVTPYFYNNGWHPLLTVNKPILDYEDYEIKNISYRLGDGNFDYEKKKWSTLGDCLKHNQEAYKQLKVKRKEWNEDRLRKEKQKIEAYKRANS